MRPRIPILDPKHEIPSPIAKVTLPTYGVGGILPGVDLDDSALLAELMDRRDDSA